MVTLLDYVAPLPAATKLGETDASTYFGWV